MKMNNYARWAIVVVACAVLLFFALFFINQNKDQTVDQDQPPAPTVNKPVGGDTDAHGCLGPAGYSWCDPKSKCLRVWEEACYTGINQEIQYLLAKKYNRSTDDVKITITKQDGNYVSGGVKFGKDISGEGGVWLAGKIENMWQVVFSGNGSIDCDKMRQVYGFPDTILKPNFCD
jgi:hypothetical protein